MEKLSVIQKTNRLNDVWRVNDKGPGGAYRNYVICKNGEKDKMAEIKFQKGGRNTEGSIAGVTNEDLLEIVRDRLIGFQSGDFRCRENACALTHIEEALMWLNKRTEDIAERNVLGKDLK